MLNITQIEELWFSQQSARYLAECEAMQFDTDFKAAIAKRRQELIEAEHYMVSFLRKKLWLWGTAELRESSSFAQRVRRVQSVLDLLSVVLDLRL